MKNNITKIIACFFMVLLSIYSLTVISFAHPGKTDESGGHYDYDAGTYHYHHGYDEHYHTNGICPYNFDDKTDHSNNGSYSSSNSGDKIYNPKTKKWEDKSTYEYQVKDEEQSKPKNKWLNKICIILLAILLIFAPYIIIQVVRKIIKKAQSIPKSELEFILIITTIIVVLIGIMYLSDVFQNGG